jgi:DegV family protein with EDD domain
MAADDADADAATIAAALRARVPDLDLYVALDTLDYLRRSGRISGTRAAVGGLLSVKPIIAIRDGEVLQIERVRTRTKARARVVELFAQAPVERVALLGGPGTEVEALRADLLRRLPDLDPSAVLVETVGSSIGPHVGPGFAGGIVLRRR